MFQKIKKHLVGFVKNNPLPKLVAVVIAFILWMVVASSQATVGKFPGTIPVKANNTPPGLAAIIDEEEVEIEVMAEPAVWNSLSADSFTAFVDVSSHKEGTFELDVNVTTSVEGVKVVKITPPKIFVRLETIVISELPVTHKFEGSAAEGLVPGNVELVPDSVTVSGPSSQVKKINEVNIVIRLNGESNDFERLEEVVVFGVDGKKVNNLIFSPNEVLAKTSLVKASNNKTVGIKVKTSGTLAEGFYVSKVTVTPSVIDITGPNSLLRTINYIETDEIDLTGKGEIIERDVFLNLIDGIALQRGQASRARVVIEFAEESATKTLDLTIKAINLNSNLAFSYSPIPVKVTISSLGSSLAKVKSENLIFEVDLSGKSIGTYPYEILAKDIALPEGVSIINLSASSINAVLTQK